MNQSNPEVLLPMISEIEQKIQFRDQKNNEVSKVTVAWHLDHMLKTINQISKALEHSDPSTYKSTFNVPRIMSLTAAFIPRGRAESPQSVRPPEIILTKDIHTQIVTVKEAIEKLKTLDEHANFDHPVFGIYQNLIILSPEYTKI